VGPSAGPVYGLFDVGRSSAFASGSDLLCRRVPWRGWRFSHSMSRRYAPSGCNDIARDAPSHDAQPSQSTLLFAHGPYLSWPIDDAGARTLHSASSAFECAVSSLSNATPSIWQVERLRMHVRCKLGIAGGSQNGPRSTRSFAHRVDHDHGWNRSPISKAHCLLPGRRLRAQLPPSSLHKRGWHHHFNNAAPPSKRLIAAPPDCSLPGCFGNFSWR